MIFIAREEIVKLAPGDLRPNQHVELEVRDGDYRGKYPSRVEEIRGDTMVLAMPMSRGEIVTLRRETRVLINFMLNDANHAFEAPILERMRDPLPVFVVRLPTEAVKRQRRSWVRVPASLRISYTTVKDKVIDDELFLETSTIDVSGGGLLFYSDRGYRPGESMRIILHLPKRPLEVKARVIRSTIIPDQQPRLYQTGVEFIDIRERQRDRVMKYIFEQQRMLIKKGLM
ncbi:MAG: hypothetical protein HPY50_14790 [Firmicutes bacterium]|nr:hypothetical protein [Bacillota bacterium]